MEKSRAHETKDRLQIYRCTGAQSGRGEGDKGWVTMALESSESMGMHGGEQEGQAGERCGQMSALESSSLMWIQAVLWEGREWSRSGQESVIVQSY